MGNRDINKMRIVNELGIGNIHEQNTTLPKHDGVYWLKGTLCSGLPADPEGNIVPSSSASERLKWMLYKTMGCAQVDAFELRRDELIRERIAIINGTGAMPSPSKATAVSEGVNGDCKERVTVTDDEVAQSYIRSCNPVSGIMSQCELHVIYC